MVLAVCLRPIMGKTWLQSITSGYTGKGVFGSSMSAAEHLPSKYSGT